MARQNEHDAHRHLSVSRPTRVTNAQWPRHKQRVTLHDLLHGRRWAGVREAIFIAVFALCAVVVAYKWLSAADPRLP